MQVRPSTLPEASDLPPGEPFESDTASVAITVDSIVWQGVCGRTPLCNKGCVAGFVMMWVVVLFPTLARRGARTQLL